MACGAWVVFAAVTTMRPCFLLRRAIAFTDMCFLCTLMKRIWAEPVSVSRSP